MLRRIVLLVALVGGLLAAVPASALPGCTKTGTNGDDTLFGTDGADIICGLLGDDFETGSGGNDTLRGGDHNDTLVGGGGSDELLGGRGSDRLYAVDGVKNEQVTGGDGVDYCHIDKGDKTLGCENVFVSTPGSDAREAMSVSASLSGDLTLLTDPPILYGDTVTLRADFLGSFPTHWTAWVRLACYRASEGRVYQRVRFITADPDLVSFTLVGDSLAGADAVCLADLFFMRGDVGEDHQIETLDDAVFVMEG